ncbi:class I SAM-dependent methyltransferase [Umezawaea sp. Da 62-37]|uniref:class I SAM-dependent methyltransferase n=1 Tax=Umezawaea sp. Da 62-37 TaxID=3075927 RepID=UPI0028F6F7D5|nr:class I SAM-dependent methyltransferase [Umezawaea sp. Da 62-37]WNV88282.1 class I SAM-dependent methyltransferase [Umezawaea sp. Da 62-37]
MRTTTTAEVPGAFDAAAPAYDFLVRMNPGYHDALRRSASGLRLSGGGKGLRLLDLGCGTGASTAALLAAAPEAEIVGVDASEGMLAQARRKPWPDTVSFVHARAEELLAAGVRGPFDGVFAAYLVRNLPDPDPVLEVVRDLLKPGAPFVVHEYSVRDSLPSTVIWTAVCWAVVIPSGAVATRTPGIFTYLWRSALAFDGAGALRDRLRRSGFTAVRSDTVSGWQRGIVHTFVGHAPKGDQA